ncbi:MAG: hypothetical protein EXR45_05065 [Chloroflexi bacterium]|nr:hypothetical protein [Chloroflexota bacterium]
MKQLIFWVVGGVVGTLLGSCTIGIAASEFGGRQYVGAARDIGILVIALMTWISALIGLVIWFSLATGTGWLNGSGVRGMRWIAGKADRTEHATSDYLGRFVVKPVARTMGFASEVASVGHHVANRSRDAKRTVVEAVSSARTYSSDMWRRATRRARIVIQTGVDGLHDLPTR